MSASAQVGVLRDPVSIMKLEIRPARLDNYLTLIDVSAKSVLSSPPQPRLITGVAVDEEKTA